jgi:hypothetical protein
MDERPTLLTLPQAKLNIINMENLYDDSGLAWQSNTAHPYNQVLKYEGLGYQLIHATNVY